MGKVADGGDGRKVGVVRTVSIQGYTHNIVKMQFKKIYLEAGMF